MAKKEKAKKEKAGAALTDDLKAMIKLVPKLEKFIKVFDEITGGYLKYRKKGGPAIPEIEKHVAVGKLDSEPKVKAKKEKPMPKAKTGAKAAGKAAPAAKDK